MATNAPSKAPPKYDYKPRLATQYIKLPIKALQLKVSQLRLLMMIIANSKEINHIAITKITTAKLAELLGKSESTIKQQLKELQNCGLIVRERKRLRIDAIERTIKVDLSGSTVKAVRNFVFKGLSDRALKAYVLADAFEQFHKFEFASIRSMAAIGKMDKDTFKKGLDELIQNEQPLIDVRGNDYYLILYEQDFGAIREYRHIGKEHKTTNNN